MQILDHVDPTFWWDVAQRCPYATFFHTPLWNEIARWYHPHYRDRSVGFITPRGTRAVFPLLETKRVGPLRNIISSFEGCYGGLIADGPLSDDEAAAIYGHIANWHTMHFYYLATPLAPRYRVEEDLVFDQETTHILHLDADFEAVFGRFEKSTRTSYRRGLREGAVVRPAGSLDDYRAYYAAYRDAVERWGQDEAYGYPWKLFAHFYELERRHPEQIRLWVIELDDKVVGGTLAFYWNQHVGAWHGTVTREALKRKAMVVLDTEISRDAAARGYRHYDLNTSAKMAGVITYKESLGTVAYPIARCHSESHLFSPALRLYRKARYGSEESLFTRGALQELTQEA